MLIILNYLFFKFEKLKLKMSSMLLDDSRIKELDKRLTMVTNLYYLLLSFNII